MGAFALKSNCVSADLGRLCLCVGLCLYIYYLYFNAMSCLFMHDNRTLDGRANNDKLLMRVESTEGRDINSKIEIVHTSPVGCSQNVNGIECVLTYKILIKFYLMKRVEYESIEY